MQSLPMLKELLIISQLVKWDGAVDFFCLREICFCFAVLFK
jgi:hypothetical protein